MIILLKKDTDPSEEEEIVSFLENNGIKPERVSDGDVGLLITQENVGEDLKQMLSGHRCVSSLVGTSREVLKCEKDGKPFSVSGKMIGDGALRFAAGPCSVQDHDMIEEAARRLKDAGADMLRGGAFKPRTSPYSFQGLGKKGLEMMAQAGKKYSLLTVSEIMSETELDLFRDIDILQVGARNMQNYTLLTELGRSGKPVCLKRGFASTVEELLYACEYIFKGGNERVILCERGIRTFEKAYRNVLDVSAIAWLKTRTLLPVFADPSHAAGSASLVETLSLAACAAGCDGLLIEVNDDPHHALSDSRQAVSTQAFMDIKKKTEEMKKLLV